MKIITNHSPDYRLGDAGEIVALIVISFLSGNLWILINRRFFSGPREFPWASSRLGRTIIGLVWFALVMGIIYPLQSSETFSFRHIIDVLLPAIIFGMFMQVVVFALLNFFGDGQ